MKIAVCFSGSIRSFKECYPTYYKHLIGPYQPDVFMYLPDEEKAKDKLSVIKKYKNLKEIKLIKEVNIDEKNYNTRLANCTAQQVLRLMTYLKESETLKTNYEKYNNFKYDWVFRCRPDTRIREGSKLEDLQTLENDFLYIPNHNHAGGINDRFAFGSSDLMKLYHNRIDFLDEFFEAGGRIYDEGFLRSYIEKYCIPIKSTTIQVEIVREWGEIKFQAKPIGSFPTLNYNKDQWNFYKLHYIPKSERKK